MADNKTIGRQGEELAALFLRQTGYRVLFRNYTTTQGELDIIAEKNGVVAFVEVKTRKSKKYGRPAEAVTWNKRRHIISSALCFLQAERVTNKNYRFDIIEVYLGEDGATREINHISDAFDCN